MNTPQDVESTVDAARLLRETAGEICRRADRLCKRAEKLQRAADALRAQLQAVRRPQ